MLFLSYVLQIGHLYIIVSIQIVNEDKYDAKRSVVGQVLRRHCRDDPSKCHRLVLGMWHEHRWYVWSPSCARWALTAFQRPSHYMLTKSFVGQPLVVRYERLWLHVRKHVTREHNYCNPLNTVTPTWNTLPHRIVTRSLSFLDLYVPAFLPVNLSYATYITSYATTLISDT